MFIVIDGIDGSGKKTQIHLLYKKFTALGYETAILDYPKYGSPSAYFVEQYLTGFYGNENEIPPKAASLFYALDRYSDKKYIESLITNDTIILSNRYVSANAGHQGGKIRDYAERKEYLNWIYDLEFNILKLPKPDITFYIDIPPSVGQYLVDQKGHREYMGNSERDIHEASTSHLTNAREAFQHMLTLDETWVQINCMEGKYLKTPEEIHKEIFKRVEDFFI